MVAWSYDLQFSTIPEPNSYAILAGVSVIALVVARRR
ncbi:MAG: PEP-CTERM sorting domain-containing protein [Lentimonas sp.]